MEKTARSRPSNSRLEGKKLAFFGPKQVKIGWSLFTDEYIGIIFKSFIALLLSETGASKIMYLEGRGWVEGYRPGTWLTFWTGAFLTPQREEVGSHTFILRRLPVILCNARNPCSAPLIEVFGQILRVWISLPERILILQWLYQTYDEESSSAEF